MLVKERIRRPISFIFMYQNKVYEITNNKSQLHGLFENDFKVYIK